MYDTTAWSMKSENIQENQLGGKTDRLSGEAAANLADKMASSALPGPAAFAKAPNLSPNLICPPPPAAPGAKRRAKPAEGLCFLDNPVAHKASYRCYVGVPRAPVDPGGSDCSFVGSRWFLEPN